MRVIATGWRHWDKSEVNVDLAYLFLDQLLDLILLTNDPVLQLIHGDAPGGDQVVQSWAEANQEHHGELVVPDPLKFPAKWSKYGNAAGPLRNQEMILGGADLVLGLLHPESRGTVDCLAKAKKAKIPRMVLDWIPDKHMRPIEQGVQPHDVQPLPRAA